MQALWAIDPALAGPLDAALPYTAAEVVWAARMEMARSVEDVLARRTRALFLNARAAVRMAPGWRRSSRRNSGETRRGRRRRWRSSRGLARQYMLN